MLPNDLSNRLQPTAVPTVVEVSNPPKLLFSSSGKSDICESVTFNKQPSTHDSQKYANHIEGKQESHGERKETGKILESVFFVLTCRMSFLCHKLTFPTSTKGN